MRPMTFFAVVILCWLSYQEGKKDTEQFIPSEIHIKRPIHGPDMTRVENYKLTPFQIMYPDNQESIPIGTACTDSSPWNIKFVHKGRTFIVVAD